MDHPESFLKTFPNNQRTPALKHIQVLAYVAFFLGIPLVVFDMGLPYTLVPAGLVLLAAGFMQNYMGGGEIWFWGFLGASYIAVSAFVWILWIRKIRHFRVGGL